MKTATWFTTVVAAIGVATGVMAGDAEAQRRRPVEPPADRPTVSYDGGRTWVTPRTDVFGPPIRRYRPPDADRVFISDGETTITAPRPRRPRPAPVAPVPAGPQRCDFYQCGDRVVAVPKGSAAPAGGVPIGDGVISGGAVEPGTGVVRERAPARRGR
jgi:hypothetical protein